MLDGIVHPGDHIGKIVLNSIPAAGRSIKEISFFGMPFGWYDELGPVVYVENKYETIYAQLNSRGMAAVAPTMAISSRAASSRSGRMAGAGCGSWGSASRSGCGCASRRGAARRKG
jgi:hypothetical protein